MKSKLLKWSLITLFWLLLWQILSMAVASTLLLPGPVDTVKGLFTLLGDSKFYQDVLTTVGRCLLAMIMSLVIGFILSIVSYRFKIVRDILALPVAFFKAVPVMAVAIYLILLLTAGSVPVFVCFIMCFPIVYTNLLEGLDSMDASLLEMTSVYNIKGGKLIRFFYIPSLYPFFKSAMSIIAGMSWKAIVTAEVLSIPKFSLGYELMNAKYYLNTDLLFAYVVVIIFVSVVFEKLIKKILEYAGVKAYQGSKFKKQSGSEQISGHHDETLGEGLKLNIKGKMLKKARNIVKLKSISKSFGDKAILKNYSLELQEGKVTACMGASGSGKTTLIRIIAGLEKVDTGEVEVNAKKIAILFQEDRLLPWLNVYDNLAIVDNNEKKINDLLRSVGLENEAWKLPSELSGGMKYRLAMARTFLYDGDLILADEAFQGLDDKTKKFVIKNLWKPGVAGKTVLMITHSDEDKKLADKVVEI